MEFGTDLIRAWFARQWSADDLTFTVAAIAVGCAFAYSSRPVERSSRQSAKVDEEVRRENNTGILRRLWWHFHPPHDLMRVDGLVIDRSRKPHAAWLGPTGAGKTSAVAAVRCDGERAFLAATPDLSDPLIDATLRVDGFRWTAGVSTTPIDFLIGTPLEVAGRLTEVFRSGGNGVWKRTAYLATADVIRDIDAAGEDRTLTIVGQRLKDAIRSDRELKMACAGWADRYLSVGEKFGQSAGPDGVDLAELLQDGVSVLIDNDAFTHPALCEDVVALALAEAQRVAFHVPAGFRLIFEEAGQLGDRIDLAAPFFRAGRRRKISVDVLTQAESDLKQGGSDALTSNIATYVYFSQDLASLQKVAADRLRLKPVELDKMKDFTAWIAHGRIRRLVRFPKPAKLRELAASARGPLYRQGEEERNGRRKWAVVELPRRRDEEQVRPRGMLALPPPSTTLQKILKSIYPEGGCERWGGKHDRSGHRETGKKCPADCSIPEHVDGCYGLVWVDGRWQKVHRLRWELAYGVLPLDPQGRKLTLDHLSGVCAYKDCSKLTHLEITTRGENVKRRWRTGGKVG